MTGLLVKLVLGIITAFIIIHLFLYRPHGKYPHHILFKFVALLFLFRLFNGKLAIIFIITT